MKSGIIGKGNRILRFWLTGNIYSRRCYSFLPALAASQSQLEAATKEITELKSQITQSERDYSMPYTDYTKLEVELSNPEPVPETNLPQQQQPSSSTQP